jgi:hypothetical protein
MIWVDYRNRRSHLLFEIMERCDGEYTVAHRPGAAQLSVVWRLSLLEERSVWLAGNRTAPVLPDISHRD